MVHKECKCQFHTTTKWNDGKIDNICLKIKHVVKCDGESKVHLISCPMWGELLIRNNKDVIFWKPK